MSSNRSLPICLLDAGDVFEELHGLWRCIFTNGKTIAATESVSLLYYIWLTDRTGTDIARALIRARLLADEDIPSPTYTLVQTYDVGECEIWHADLYRLSGPDEAVELGLEDAFSDAIVLVEWPDRLGDLAPDTALTLSLSATPDDRRRVMAAARSPRWNPVLQALETGGWGG